MQADPSLQEVPAETPAEAPEPEGQEEIPAWLKQPATFEETSVPAVSEPTPLAPELPSWLADVENTDEEEETPTWMPP